MTTEYMSEEEKKAAEAFNKKMAEQNPPSSVDTSPNVPPSNDSDEISETQILEMEVNPEVQVEFNKYIATIEQRIKETEQMPQTEREVFDDNLGNAQKTVEAAKQLESISNEVLALLPPEAQKTIIRIREEAAKCSYDLVDKNKKVNRREDGMTGLPLREKQNEKIMEKIFEYFKSPEDRKKIGLLVCDLNEFKIVNDTAGHAVGDEFLQRIGKRMLDNAKEIAALFNVEADSGRDGGDEFCILLYGDKDLTTPIMKLPSKERDNLLKNEIVSEILQQNPNANLNDIISEYTSKKFAEQTNNELFLSTKQSKRHGELEAANPQDAKNYLNNIIKEKLKRNTDQGTEYPPEGFVFRSYVSTQGATLHELMDKPDMKNFRGFLRRQEIKNGTDALYSLMGALRGLADKKANDKKFEDKMKMLTSGDESEQFRVKLGRTGTDLVREATKRIGELNLERPLTPEEIAEAVDMFLELNT